MSTEGQAGVDELMNRFSDMQGRATARSVFGEPLKVDGRTIIPVAQVRAAFGVGMGRGSTPKAEGTGTGEGGGGGGGITVRPIAIVEIDGQETKVKPIPDVTRLALAGMALVAWNVFWITYTIRRAVKRKQ